MAIIDFDTVFGAPIHSNWRAQKVIAPACPQIDLVSLFQIPTIKSFHG